MLTLSKNQYLPYPLIFACALLLAITGCSSSNDDGDESDAGVSPQENAEENTDPDTNPDDPANTAAGEGGDGGETDSVNFAFVSGATPTFDAGQIERLEIADTVTAAGSYPATLSDIVVATDGTDVYQVGRFNIDSITRFSATELTTPVYQYSVLQGETSPNTFDIVFASETKAYVFQDGGTSVLIVNPAAETAEEFITGSLDISAYDDDAPNAVSGVIANGQLFVLMQRLTGFNPDKAGFVAVFDTATDTEIATGMNSDGLNGIALSTFNPSTLQYIDELNEVVVTGRGNVFVEFNMLPGDPYSGGIETIDVDTFNVDLLVDDGDESNNNGFILDSHVSTAERGYIINSEGFQNNTLRSYNPTTGVVDEGVVGGLEGLDLITLATGPQGRVWVGIGGTEPGFVLIDPADNTISVDLVPTQFVPNRVVFVESGS